jgi:hypothetical protein
MSYIKQFIIVTVVLGALFLGLSNRVQAQQASSSGCKVECKTCASTCEQTLKYCRKQGHVAPEHIKALQDCISTCKQSADFMERGSSLQNSACNLCEKACRSCAESCADFKKDKTMQDCAEECQKCAQFCHEMAK